MKTFLTILCLGSASAFALAVDKISTERQEHELKAKWYEHRIKEKNTQLEWCAVEQ